MNIKLLDFTLKSLQRRFVKKISIIFIFSFLVFLLVSVFTISSSIKKELEITVDSLPELIVQRMIGGRQTLIPIERAYKIATIPGVESAHDRTWGYYYFINENVNFTVIGLDFDLDAFKDKYYDIINFYSEKTDTVSTPFIIVGKGVNELLEKNFYKNYYIFNKEGGGKIEAKIIGTFEDESSLESNDIILMPLNYVRELFDISENLANDIVVKVPNSEEIELVKHKLQNMYPDCRIVSKKDIKSSYQNIFDYKSGIFLTLLITAFLSYLLHLVH